MGKILFCLLGVCSLSSFLMTNPEHHNILTQFDVRDKEVMSFCAVRYLQNNPTADLSIGRLTLNKPELVRIISDRSMSDLSSVSSQKSLLELLIEKSCPVSPPDKRRKMLTRSVSHSSQDSLALQLQDDCVVVTTPPASPIVKSRAIKHIDRLHRQWKSKWNSDTDLQSLLAVSCHVAGKKTRSDQL